MPEGDTVYLAAHRLDAALHGQILTRSEFRVPRYAAVDLAGRSIRSVFPRGKHLFFDFGDVSLHTHFKMQGSWHLYREQQRWRKPGHRARIVLQTPQWTAVGFDLPVVELIVDPDVVIRHLGPDLLSESFDADEAARRIMLDPARPLGDALIDQKVVAGLGNVYKSEVCFVAGIDPRIPVGLVPDVPLVVRLARRMIRANRATGSQITTGDTRPGRQHWVYGRGTLPCMRCATPISMQRDGSERVTYWCARCQKSS